jgi:hypothetical protein
MRPQRRRNSVGKKKAAYEKGNPIIESGGRPEKRLHDATVKLDDLGASPGHNPAGGRSLAPFDDEVFEARAAGAKKRGVPSVEASASERAA